MKTVFKIVTAILVIGVIQLITVLLSLVIGSEISEGLGLVLFMVVSFIVLFTLSKIIEKSNNKIAQ